MTKIVPQSAQRPVSSEVRARGPPPGLEAGALLEPAAEEGSCVDRYTLCSKYCQDRDDAAYLQWLQQYFGWMSEWCPASCRLCPQQ